MDLANATPARRSLDARQGRVHRTFSRSVEGAMENGRVAVVTTAPGELEIGPEADPSPEPGEVVVETLATGICGSDLHLFAGDHPYAHFPLAQGHEAVGRIVALGQGADAALEGALVAIEPTL